MQPSSLGVARFVKRFPTFTKTESSLSCIQNLVSGFFPDPAESISHHQVLLHKISFNTVLPPATSLPSSVFHSGIQNKNVCTSHISHVCYMQFPLHPPEYGHFDNIGKECEVLSSLLCNSLRLPYTSSLLWLNVLFSITISNTVELYSSDGAT
jgi:hypothetical protein